MWQMVFAHISIKGWIICSYVHGFFYCSLKVLVLFPYYGIVANLYMEDLESKAIQSAPHPPAFWKRFVDDTFVIIKSFHKQEFLDHINSIDTNIQFTSEESSEDGSMPSLTC